MINKGIFLALPDVRNISCETTHCNLQLSHCELQDKLLCVTPHLQLGMFSVIIVALQVVRKIILCYMALMSWRFKKASWLTDWHLKLIIYLCWTFFEAIQQSCCWCHWNSWIETTENNNYFKFSCLFLSSSLSWKMPNKKPGIAWFSRAVTLYYRYNRFSKAVIFFISFKII